MGIGNPSASLDHLPLGVAVGTWNRSWFGLGRKPSGSGATQTARCRAGLEEAHGIRSIETKAPRVWGARLGRRS